MLLKVHSYTKCVSLNSVNKGEYYRKQQTREFNYQSEHENLKITEVRPGTINEEASFVLSFLWFLVTVSPAHFGSPYTTIGKTQRR